MAENSAIEWTDHTFNPWIGCTKVSPGCEHCYAEARMDKRLRSVRWGSGEPRRRTKTWADPKHWNEQHASFFARHGRRQRVFCASLADWLDNEVPVEWLVDLLDLVRITPNLDWLLLTKRIGNWKQRLAAALANAVYRELHDLAAWIAAWLDGTAPHQVRLGATIVNQPEADRDIPKLLATPACVRFLSMEPLLGPVDLRRVDPGEDRAEEMGGWGFCDAMVSWLDALAGEGWSAERRGQELVGKEISWHEPRIDWVIVGGESGHHARPMHYRWARALRDQCAAAGVPFLFKQWGEWLPISDDRDGIIDGLYRSVVKAQDHEDQAALDESYGRRCTVRSLVVHNDGAALELLTPMAFAAGKDAMQTFRVGKKAAGRLLDGREHNAFPEVR